MREIKFRAWLYIDGSMQYEGLFGAEKFGGRDCEIMQYTGLKDKHGKEIYEGDIVQEARCKHVSTVVFLDGMYQLQHEHRGQDGNVLGVYQQPLGFLVDPVEVLGNIYEDSGLLKQ